MIKQQAPTMAGGQSDEPLCVHISEDCLGERTHVLRSLLRDRLKKKYQNTDDYVPMKLYLSQGKNKRIQTEQVPEGLKVTVKDFLKDENVIEYDDLFKPCPVTNEDVRTVLMKGIHRVGKTTALKMFMLDWAEGRTHQDITFVLPLSLTELSSLRTKKCSFMELLGLIFPELMDSDILKHARVLFVLDDLKSCRVKLNFWHTKSCGDPAKKLTLSALLVNLMRGDFFPKAQIWVASSSEGSDFIPSKYVQRVVEIQGLDDVQWEEYVRRAVRDSNVAATAIVHVKSSNNLYFMRSQPGFCQIAATVVEEVITKMSNTELPLTLTEMYTHFLLIQMRRKASNGNAEANHMKTDAEEILKLGKLAWHTLENDYLTVFKEDLRNNDMAPSFAAELSQKWPAFLKEEELTQEKAYHFTHQSTQAYLSALYVAVNYEPSQGNVLHYTLTERAKHLLKSSDAPRDMHKRAVDKALQSKEGTFDSFLIFLLGISAGPSFRDLSCFLPDSFKRGSSETIVPYILRKIKKSSSLDVSNTLIRCLDELNVSYTVGKSKSQRKVQDNLTPSEWSALSKTLLNSEDQQRIFNLKEYLNPEMAFVRMLPVIKASRILRLCECTDLCWMLLASALRSPSNSVREIDIQDTICEKGNIWLSEALKSPNCKVEILRTPHCPKHDDSETYPPILALLSNPSHLRELDLNFNMIVNDKTQEDLATLLVVPGAHLEKLVVHYSKLSANFFKNLATALRSDTCCLNELDLRLHYGFVGDERVIPLLSEGLGDSCCQLRVLRLADGSIRQTGFTALVSAFSSNPSHLKELDLSYSTPGLEAFLQLCSLLGDSRFKLETLILINLEWWDHTNPTFTFRKPVSTPHFGGLQRQSTVVLMSEAYKALALALCSSNLRVLDLSNNCFENSIVELLSAGLANPACKLEVLRMARCNVSGVGAATLANALLLNPSHLRELNLSYNPVEGTGFEQLNSLGNDPAIKLEKIIVEGFGERRSIEELCRCR
ncbi:NACHT, LRR and PYD domains-containing protein 14-like isoform X2 [Salminus brasiliensis]|uniref:NACHT, LRR and PYD domains-containing protein 14-like isoform X2 n=1 Tax=Salminus brasiliensis TaxID=930266 RepID=UPI003B836B4D